jgi:hypothetical protein
VLSTAQIGHYLCNWSSSHREAALTFEASAIDTRGHVNDSPELTSSSADSPARRRRRVVSVVVLVGALGVGLVLGEYVRNHRHLDPGRVVAECTLAFSPPMSTVHRFVNFGPVGTGTSVGLMAVETTSGWQSCFAGMGTGTAPIPRAVLHKPLAVAFGVVDGTARHGVLLLIHQSLNVQSIVAVTSTSRSTVLASGENFEVLDLANPNWPAWHAPWLRHRVTVGWINAYNHHRVVASIPLMWCPGSINFVPNSGC